MILSSSTSILCLILIRGTYSYLFISAAVIFKVYDSDRNGKVSFKDMLEVLKDLSGSFMSDEQREVSPYIYMLLVMK